MKTVMLIYTTIFFFAIAGMIALANVVGDPVLYLIVESIISYTVL